MIAFIYKLFYRSDRLFCEEKVNRILCIPKISQFAYKMNDEIIIILFVWTIKLLDNKRGVTIFHNLLLSPWDFLLSVTFQNCVLYQSLEYNKWRGLNLSKKKWIFFCYFISMNFSSQRLIDLFVFFRDSWISTWSLKLAMPRAKYSTSRWRVITTGISQKSPLVRQETVRINYLLHANFDRERTEKRERTNFV